MNLTTYERISAEMKSTSSKNSDTLPSVSIIIVNYKGGDYLGKCLSSILRQAYLDYEVLVVDNASLDGSIEYVEREFPEVRVVKNEINWGFGYANNLGAKHATGDYLVFLNPDTTVREDWLGELVEALQNSPATGLATPKILLQKEPNKINTCGNEMHYTGLTLCRGIGEPASSFSEVEEVNAISGAAFVIKRYIFEEIGGFDESFFTYVEDADLSWRARLAGYRCMYVPSAVVYHDYRLRFGHEKIFYQERNRYLMLLKNLRWRTLLFLLPALMLSEVVIWGYILWWDRRQVKGKLRSYQWLIANWQKIMQSRCRVQSLRKVEDRRLLSQCSYCLDFEQLTDGWVSTAAHLVFDTLFFLLQKTCLALI